MRRHHLPTAVRPLDRAQFDASAVGVVPAPTRVRDGIRAIAVPFRQGVPFTLCYVIEAADGRIHLIDPGADTPANRTLLSDALAAGGTPFERVAGVTVSHLHGDHLGLASWISAETGVAVGLHPADERDLRSGQADARYSHDLDAMGELWGVPAEARSLLTPTEVASLAVAPPPALAMLADEESLPIEGRRVQVVHTPGHTRGHVCLVLPDEHLVLTGDHILPHLHPGIARGAVDDADDPIADYLASLERLAPWDAFDVGPGHGYVFSDLGTRRREIAAHVLGRARRIAAVDADGSATDWEVAGAQTWAGGALTDLPGNGLQSALRQTGAYRRFLRNGGLAAGTAS